LDYIKSELQFELETVLHDEFNAEPDEITAIMKRPFTRGFDNCICDRVLSSNEEFFKLAKQEIKNGIYTFASKYAEIRTLKNSTRRKKFIEEADKFFKEILNRTLKYY